MSDTITAVEPNPMDFYLLTLIIKCAALSAPLEDDEETLCYSVVPPRGTEPGMFMVSFHMTTSCKTEFYLPCPGLQAALREKQYPDLEKDLDKLEAMLQAFKDSRIKRND